MKRVNLCLFGISVCLLLCNAVAALEGEGIIGGDLSEPGQFKYQISLQVNGRGICGGAIISDDFILTAAHCVIDQVGQFQKYLYKVNAGSISLNQRDGVTVAVDKIYVLTGYKPPLTNNDIAVLKLKSGLGLGTNPALAKLELPKDDLESYAGKVAMISGYGWNSIRVQVDPLTGFKKELGGSTDYKLRFAKVNIISNYVCGQKNYPQTIENSHICGQVFQRNKHEGICSGDSGGPLVYGNTIIGVVSTSPPGCEEHEAAAAYTRVSSFIKFVQNVMNGVITNEIREHTVKIPSWPFQIGR